MVSSSGVCTKRIVVDACHHMLGRLSSIIAKELLNSQKAIVVHYEGAVTTLEPPGLGPLCLAAPRGGRPLRLVVPPGRGGTHIVLVAVLRHRHLIFPLPGGGRTSGT
jgi:hypothetical protein